MKKKAANISEPTNLRHRTELFLSKNLSKIDSFPTEADALKLIHELQVHQIELEMQNEELMLAIERAKAATKKATELFDFAPSGYFTVAQNGEIIEINLTGAKMLGKDRSHLKNRLLTHFIASSFKPIFNRFLYTVFENKNPQSCEVEFSSNGITTYINFTGHVIENSPNCWLIGKNVTELRQTEVAFRRSESRFKDLFNRHNAVMLLLDPRSGMIIDANEAASQFYGYKRSTFLSLSINDITVQSEDITSEYEQVFREDRNYFVFTHLLANGEKRIVEIHSSHIDMMDRVVLYLIIHDITERQLAEENLRTSIQLTKNIIENTPSLFYLVDLEGKFVLVNQKLETILGTPGKKLIGNTRESFLPKEIARQHRVNDLTVIESNQVLTFEEEYIESDGKHFYLTQKFPLFNSEGQIYAIGGISTDITMNKKIVESLKISEAKWHKLFEILPVGVSIIDKNKVIDFNPTLNQILDISNEGLLKCDFTKRIYFRPDLSQMPAEESPTFRCMKEKRMIRDVEIGILKEDGTLIWTNVSAVPFSSFDSCITVTTNITERKKMQDKLEETNRRLIDAQKVAKVGSWETNLSNMEVNWSEETFRIFGLNMNSFHTNHPNILNFIHPDDRAKFDEAFVKSFNTHNTNSIQHRIITPTGEIKFVEENWIIYYNDQKEAIRALGTCSDITERKLAEEKLRESEQKYATLFYKSVVPSIMAELPAAICTDINEAFERTFGYSREECIGKTFVEVGIIQAKQFNQVFSEAQENGLAYYSDLQLTTKSAEKKKVSLATNMVELGGHKYTITMLLDLTEQKQAEEALKESEERYRLVFENSMDAILSTATDGSIFSANRAACEMFQRSEEEICRIGRDGLVDKNDPRLSAMVEERKLTGKAWGEITMIRKDGSTFPADLTTSVFFDHNNEQRTSMIIRDNAERKLAEENLSESEKRYTTLFNSIDEGFCIIEMIFDKNDNPLDYRFLELNPSFEKQTGLVDVKGKTMRHLVPDTEESWFELYGKIALTGEPLRFTNRAEYLNRWYDVYAFQFGKPENRQVAILFNDITQSFEALNEINHTKAQLDELHKHLNEVREEERTSIAREIHDDLGQSLAGLKIDLLEIKEDVNEDKDPSHKIDKAIFVVETTIKKIQKLSSELRPQMLDELGLASAIEWQSNEFKKRTGIKIKLSLEEMDDLDKNIAISLYRIFQAALTNIMLHSKATSISVNLESKDQMIQLMIIDNGIGITSEQLYSSKSFGLIGMRERANQISGKLKIITDVNNGTEIIVNVPLAQENVSR